MAQMKVTVRTWRKTQNAAEHQRELLDIGTLRCTIVCAQLYANVLLLLPIDRMTSA
jgi:hypothetical protein